MTKELSFEAYLSISQKKFEIYLLDKKKLKNIYKEEIWIKNNTDQIDYNLLNNFLENNIFKIEKLIGQFLKNIIVIIDDIKILNFSIGIKKKSYDRKINKKYLETSLIELKYIFNENYQNNKIMHFIINKYSIDGVDQTTYDEEITGDNMCIEVSFVSVPNFLIKEIITVLQKYQIKIDSFYDKKYIQNFSKDVSTDLSIIAFKIRSGENKNEISFLPKSLKKKGFFEKFFQLFS